MELVSRLRSGRFSAVWAAVSILLTAAGLALLVLTAYQNRGAVAVAETASSTRPAVQTVVRATAAKPAPGAAVAAPAVQTGVSPAGSAVSDCTPVAFGIPSQLQLDDAPEGLNVQADSPTQYRIYGNMASTLRAQIQRCGPGSAGSSDAEFTGQTSYNLDWQYDVATIPDGNCAAAGVRVGLHTGVAMPYWQAAGSAASGLAGRWQSFVGGLLTHEQGHVNIDKTYAAKLVTDLENMGTVPCDELTADVNAVTNADTAALNQANDAYDAATGHGAAQGAVLPTY